MKFDWLEKKNFKLHFQFRFVWERERESVSPPLLGKSRCVLCVCVCVCLFWKSTARCNNNFPFSLSRRILQKISTQVGLFSSLLKRWRAETRLCNSPALNEKTKYFHFPKWIYWGMFIDEGIVMPIKWEGNKRKKRNVFRVTYVLETWKTIDDRELSRRPAVTLRKWKGEFIFYTKQKKHETKFNYRNFSCATMRIIGARENVIFFLHLLKDQKTSPVGICLCF